MIRPLKVKGLSHDGHEGIKNERHSFFLFVSFVSFVVQSPAVDFCRE